MHSFQFLNSFIKHFFCSSRPFFCFGLFLHFFYFCYIIATQFFFDAFNLLLQKIFLLLLIKFSAGFIGYFIF